ncbi:MAG: FeoB-associated Cys-rich membrane protein [Firmicutes bacterium]|nr:FeoB-associated Cys-rich membrane protein [Bacillota bacterium]
MADLIVIAILAAAVCGVIYKMRKDKKAGKHSCGGNCASCAFSCDQRKEE